ncbi:MAG TPA: DUF748 domain-containing protein, partial [Steroidobacteraceae bacterium]|nr:DUF748 domain-containing protein [Steroidobacteraceae bacterium]
MTAILKSKPFVAAVIVAALVGLYALLGFQVAPGIVRDQAAGFVRENYGRELQVGEVRVHPFKLQLEVRDLALPDTDARTMLGFARLFVDFELSSLWQRALVFKDVTLEVPVARAVVRPDGSLNLGDLALPENPGDEDAPLPSIWIQSLAVERGAVTFIDSARTTPFERTFESVGFGLRDFRTTPEGGDFKFTARSQADEAFDWQGRFALEPRIASQGQFQIARLRAPGVAEFLGDTLPFQLTDGSIDLAGSYQISLGEQLELGLQLPKVELVELGLRARGAEADWVRIPSLSLTDTAVTMPAQSVTLGKVAIAGLQAQAWISADGAVNLQQLFAPDGGVPTSTPDATATTASATEPATGREWTVEVASVELTDASIDFEDRMAEPAKKFALAPVNLRVDNASLDLARPLPVTLDALINGQARFEAAGTLTPEPLSADLDVKLANARMQILQPYVLPVADLTINGGELGVTGKVRLDPPGGRRPELSFDGDVTIDGFRSADNSLNEDFVNFERLYLQTLSFTMAPDALSIDRVLLRQPYARVIISQEQIVNIAAVLDPQGTAAALAERRAAAAAEAARTPAERRAIEREQKAADKAATRARKSGNAPAAPPPSAPVAETLPVRIREVRIERGRMNFSDFFIEPDFAADVQDLSGTVTGLSSAPDSKAAVALEGNLEEFSPVSIEGDIQPFDFGRHTDLRLRFENISLPIFNPYSGPVAGYNIAKGKLTTALHYRIENRQLDAQHNIRIDQLEWGEATESQGEATLPVKFATSLLKDRDGVINLDVPVGGTLDDPTFRIGPIVWQVIKNIIVKAVTAPFALLGSLFEGAEEAQFVDFAPGEAILDPTTAERLAALAKSLAEKPQLKLDVPIGVVAEIDRPALAERAFQAAVGTTPALETLEPKQRIEILSAMVRKQTGAEPAIPEPPPPPEGTSRAEAKALRQNATIDSLTAAARAGVVVPDAELARLGEERAAAIE